MSDVIFLSNVRLSFPNLAEPQKRKDPQTGEERISYNCELILPRDHAGLGQFMQRYAALASEKWKEHAQTVMNMIQQDRKSRCFGVGEEKVKQSTLQPYDGYPGNYFITVGNRLQPQMIGPDGKPAEVGNTMAYQMLARKLYGGCRVNAAIKPWLQENKHGRGVRCDLIAIQFAADDTPFGESMPDVSGMFGAAAPATPAAPAGFGAMPSMPAPPFMGAPAASTGFTPPWQQ